MRVRDYTWARILFPNSGVAPILKHLALIGLLCISAAEQTASSMLSVFSFNPGQTAERQAGTFPGGYEAVSDLATCQ